jgi:hypothetical protein
MIKCNMIKRVVAYAKDYKLADSILGIGLRADSMNDSYLRLRVKPTCIVISGRYTLYTIEHFNVSIPYSCFFNASIII